MLRNVFHVLPELVWCGFGVILMLLQPFVKNRQALTFIAMVGAAAGTLVTFFTLAGHWIFRADPVRYVQPLLPLAGGAGRISRHSGADSYLRARESGWQRNFTR